MLLIPTFKHFNIIHGLKWIPLFMLAKLQAIPSLTIEKKNEKKTSVIDWIWILYYLLAYFIFTFFCIQSFFYLSITFAKHNILLCLLFFYFFCLEHFTKNRFHLYLCLELFSWYMYISIFVRSAFVHWHRHNSEYE